MPRSPVKTLLLYARRGVRHSYYEDWLDAFLGDRRYSCTALDAGRGGSRREASRLLSDCDLAVLLHSTNADSLEPLEGWADLLCSRRGKLLAFVGNEVNLPFVSMGDKIGFLRRIEADFIGTQLPLEAGRWLFEECSRSRVIPLPHALNPTVFRPMTPQKDRLVDIGVRTFRYLPFLGDNDRNALMDYFLERSFAPPLALDIDTGARFSREAWARFLDSCRATIATEAGSHYLERDDRTVRAVQEYLMSREKERGRRVVRRGSLPDRIGRSFPARVRRIVKEGLVRMGAPPESVVNRSVPFEEIHERFFRDLPKPPAYCKAISSRHFDAAGTGTCQIMFRGRFNDILAADEHYIALERDFSNIDNVLARFRDETYRARMTERTLEYVMEEHTYRNRLDTVLSLLDEP